VGCSDRSRSRNRRRLGGKLAADRGAFDGEDDFDRPKGTRHRFRFGGSDNLLPPGAAGTFVQSATTSRKRYRSGARTAPRFNPASAVSAALMDTAGRSTPKGVGCLLGALLAGVADAHGHCVALRRRLPFLERPRVLEVESRLRALRADRAE